MFSSRKRNTAPGHKRQASDSCVVPFDYTQVSKDAASRGDKMASGVNLRHGLLHCEAGMFLACTTRAGTTRFLVAWMAWLLISPSLLAQELKEIAPGELVRRAVARETAPNDSPKHIFCSRKQTPKGLQTRLYVETKDAIAALLIAVNGQPLPSQQQKAEDDHLAWLINNPDQLRKKQAREKEDADRTARIVKALPDAFLYEYAGTETGRAELGGAGAVLTRLKFRPNPQYSPPTRVEQVLGGMEGYLLIDPKAERIARIDGTLFRDVSFGWGIFGHLDKGGQFFVQQADIGGGDWEITQMTLKITGKILLFKSLSIISDESFSDYRPVPGDLSFAQGVEMLKAESEKRARSGETPASQKASPH